MPGGSPASFEYVKLVLCLQPSFATVSLFDLNGNPHVSDVSPDERKTDGGLDGDAGCAHAVFHRCLPAGDSRNGAIAGCGCPPYRTEPECVYVRHGVRTGGRRFGVRHQRAQTRRADRIGRLLSCRCRHRICLKCRTAPQSARRAGIRCGHDRRHCRRNGARLLFRAESRPDVRPHRHYPDDCAACRSHGRRGIAGLGRLAGDFRFLGGLFAGVARFGAIFPAQACRRRQNRQGCVRAGGWAVQTCFENTRRHGVSVFPSIQFRLDVCFFDRIILRVPAALPRYAASIRLGVCTQHHHDDVFQPYYRVAA